MKYVHGFTTATKNIGGSQMGCRADESEAIREAERIASHTLRHHTADELQSVTIIYTRSCAACFGSGLIKGARGRDRYCPDCKGVAMGAQFNGVRVVTRESKLSPCDGACCDGVERVACGACGYARPAAGKCSNPVCAAARAA